MMYITGIAVAEDKLVSLILWVHALMRSTILFAHTCTRSKVVPRVHAVGTRACVICQRFLTANDHTFNVAAVKTTKAAVRQEPYKSARLPRRVASFPTALGLIGVPQRTTQDIRRPWDSSSCRNAACRPSVVTGTVSGHVGGRTGAYNRAYLMPRRICANVVVPKD